MHFVSSLASGGAVRLVDLCWRGHDAQQARQRAVRTPGHDSYAQVSAEVNCYRELGYWFCLFMARFCCTWIVL